MPTMWWRPSPANRFRRDKFADYFRLLDRTHNGILQHDDFRAYEQAIRRSLELPEDHPRVRHLHEATEELWEEMDAVMDEAGVGSIRQDELVGTFAHLESLLRGGAPVPKWAVQHIRAVFGVLDLDESGGIDQDEYALYLRAMGSDADPAEAFARLGPDPDGTLHLDRVEVLFREWITAGETEAPGNVLMTGRLPRSPC